MRDGGLGQPHPDFDVGRTQADVLADGTRSTLFQGLQYPPAGGIGDGMQHPLECFFVLTHGYIIVAEASSE